MMYRLAAHSHGRRRLVAYMVAASLSVLAATVVNQDLVRHARRSDLPTTGFVFWTSRPRLPAASSHRFTVLRSGQNSDSAEDVAPIVDEASDAAAEQAYDLWADQFPIAAARQTFYGLSCSRASVKRRFLSLAKASRINASEALSIFGPDLWALTVESDVIMKRFDALRAVADSENEVLEFIRFAPRSIGTTTESEITSRGIPNMRARAALGAGYEALVSPIKLLFKALAKRTADQVKSDPAGIKEVSKEQLEAANAKQKEELTIASFVIFGPLSVFLGWVLYTDVVYGGPIHSKGLCAASAIPSYNIPDAEGNARLPCNCAPLWKWYLAPQLSSFSAPAVESKNCGKPIGGVKKECDPTTVGGCVWTAEDLEKDPSTWDRKELLYWEKIRKARGN